MTSIGCQPQYKIGLLDSSLINILEHRYIIRGVTFVFVTAFYSLFAFEVFCKMHIWLFNLQGITHPLSDAAADRRYGYQAVRASDLISFGHTASLCLYYLADIKTVCWLNPAKVESSEQVRK